MNTQTKRLYIQEVSVREGFQIEPKFIPTDEKVALINALSKTGLAKIECTSFTSPKAIPALADAEAVLMRIERVPGVEYAALVPNVRGADRALECRVGEMNLVMSASQTHGLANLRMTPEQSFAQKEIVRLAEGHSAVNASLSTAFGCPFEGDIPLSRVLDLIHGMVDIGIAQVALCDTTGMANPEQVAALCSAVRDRWPLMLLTAHFHDTRAMGLANALAALQVGVDRFDASLAGLGGCPFAPGAGGNVCIEDLVHMFDAMGFKTGVDLDALLSLARLIPQIVGHDVPGQVMKAGRYTRRYPAPENMSRGKCQQRLAEAKVRATDGPAEPWGRVQ